jgi:hypothetical protein
MTRCEFCGQYYCDSHKEEHDVCEEVYEFFLEEIRERLVMKLDIVEQLQRRFNQ